MILKSAFTLSQDEKRKVYSLIVPVLLESLLAQTFGAIDKVMLGHYSDAATALASVDLTASVVNLVILVANGYLIGQCASAAVYLGAKQQEKLSALVRQCCFVNFIISVIMSAGISRAAGAMVGFLNPADESVREGATEYFAIVSVGMGFQYWSMAMSSFFRGCGRNKITPIYSVSSNFLNVVLNYLLIYGKHGFPELGIRGAAIATTVSQIYSAVLATVLLLTLDTPVRLRFNGSFIPRWNIMHRTVEVGMYTVLENFLSQFGNVLCVKIIASLPKLDLSANSVTATVNGYIWAVGGAFNAAATTMMGISVGEKREDKCLAYTKYIYRSGFLCGGALAVLLFVFRGSLCGLISNDEQIVELASVLLIPHAMSAIGICTHMPLGGALRAAGDTKAPLIASFASLWFFRVLFAYIFIHVMHMGVFWSCVACLCDQLVRAVIDYILFRKGRWKKRLRTEVI